MAWDEMERMVRAAYLEGVADGRGAYLTEDQQQFMWECSDAARDLPESIT